MRDPSMETFEEFNSECLAFCGIQCLTGCGWMYALSLFVLAASPLYSFHAPVPPP